MRKIKQRLQKGKLVVDLKTKDNRIEAFDLAYLVASSYLPNPDNKTKVRHKDGNIYNNAVQNLEWVD